MKNLAYVIDYGYSNIIREYQDEYSPISDRASYENSFKEYANFDETDFCLDCLLVA